MEYFAFLFNLPWTIVGILGALLSGPKKVTFSTKPLAIIFYVRSFWWWRWLPGQAKIRGMMNGHCIQLGPTADSADLHHELIHVQQAIREPFIYPFLYWLEGMRVGYRNNKYEVEAYSKSGSRFEAE